MIPLFWQYYGYMHQGGLTMDEQEFFEEDQDNGYDPAFRQAHYTPQEKKKRLSPFGIVAIISFGVLVAAGLVGSAYLLRDSGAVLSTHSDNTVILQEGFRKDTVVDFHQVQTDTQMTPAAVYAKWVNSTVGITTSMTSTNYWGYSTTSAASGSGFILSENGYILTNHHVIENSDSITVSFYDGTTLSASLVGSDESNDIAILKVDTSGLTPVVLGDSDKMYVGDSVAAIGNPLGELTFSLTTGIVSAKNRDVTMSSGITMSLIQTDCAINSGNSGGALFNLYGEVIGITNAKYSGTNGTSIDNIAFAIPVNDVRHLIESILEKGYVAKPYLGITVVDVNRQAQAYGLPAGAAIQQIAADSPAQSAGLSLNDIITAIDGSAVSSSKQLIKMLKKCTIGQQITFTVYRQGQTLTITATLGEQH